MRGAIPPLPNMHSWSGAELKHRDSFTLLCFTLHYFTLLVLTYVSHQVDSSIRLSALSALGSCLALISRSRHCILLEGAHSSPTLP
jgi:hypothetical protein